VLRPLRHLCSLTTPQTQREGGERQFFRSLCQDEQTPDEGRLPGCYPAVSSWEQISTHSHPLTHAPSPEMSSRRSVQALRPLQIRAVCTPRRTGASIIRPRSSGAPVPLEAIGASVAPRRSLAYLAYVKAQAGTQTTAREGVKNVHHSTSLSPSHSAYNSG